MKIRKVVVEIREVTKNGEHQFYFWDCNNCGTESDYIEAYGEVMRDVTKHLKNCQMKTIETEDDGMHTSMFAVIQSNG